VFLHRLGEIRDRTYENQQHRASGLNLVVTAIILWNTRYLERAVVTLRQAAVDVIPLRNGEQSMPRDRQPDGEHALSNAERQARYRARRDAEQPPPKVHYGRPTDRRTRAQRWRDAVACLAALQAEYAAWHDTLPDSLRDSATAETLQEILDLDLDALIAIVPPRGYGRD
jgi:hypothetical protein